MSRSHTSDRDLGLRRFIRELQKAKTTEVVVGIVNGTKNQEGLDVAEYGAANEFGTSKIPERSFMRSTFDDEVQGLKSYMDSQYSMVMRGEKTIHRALGAVGMKHQMQIKHKISSVDILPKLADATIARKGSTKTLVDTGALNANITYTVRKVQ